MIKEQYISFETAKLAKEKKVFIEGCCEVYSQEGVAVRTPNGGEWNWKEYEKGEFCLRITQSLLARWLREICNMCVEVYSTAYGFVWCICDTDSGTDRMFSNDKDLGPNDGGAWDTYEEAKEDGLQEALKLI